MNWKQFLRDKSRLFKTNYSRAPLYAKLVTHRITPYLVYLFAKMGLTPDQVTTLSLIVGWVSSLLFAFPSPAVVLLAALGLETYYILDSVDGQLARLTGRCSKTGAFFDILLNYLVHPWVFIFMGIGQYRLSGHWLWMLCGSVSALSYVWLGLMWNVRAHVLLESFFGKSLTLREEKIEGQERNAGGARRQRRQWVPRQIFSLLHKVCTFPTVMNGVTIIALFEFVTGRLDLLGYLLGFYSVAIPLVSLTKISKMILEREPDQAYNS